MQLARITAFVACLAIPAVARAASGDAADLEAARAALANGDEAGARQGFDRVTKSEDARAAGEATFGLAEIADQHADYAGALREYDASLAIDPSGRFAARARTRGDVLRSHAEGNFEPFAELERARHDATLGSNPAALDALVKSADGFPTGRVRGEVWLLAADAYERSLHRPRDAASLFARVAHDPAVDELTRRYARSELVDLEIGGGDLEGARAVASEPGADASLLARVVRVEHRRFAHRASIATLVAFVLLTLAALVRASRSRALVGASRAVRGSTIFAIAYGAYVAIAGGYLASSYETGNAAPFLAFGAALAPIGLLARAWSIAGKNGPIARSFRAALSACAVLAAAFFVLESSNPAYLRSFGL